MDSRRCQTSLNRDKVGDMVMPDANGRSLATAAANVSSVIQSSIERTSLRSGDSMIWGAVLIFVWPSHGGVDDVIMSHLSDSRAMFKAS